MGWTKGTVLQGFTVRVSIDKLMEYITDSILKQIGSDKAVDSVELDEYYTEDDQLVITGTYGTDFESYYARATRYEPAEEDMNRFYIGDDGVGLFDGLPQEIIKLIDIDKVEEKEEDADYKVPEYDDDDAFDKWRDRQLEGDT